MMRPFHHVISMVLVLIAAVMGTIGTGLIYKAVAAGSILTLIWGLPMMLFGLYWCGRALDQSLRYRHQHKTR
jgi:hypothetical protein